MRGVLSRAGFALVLLAGTSCAPPGGQLAVQLVSDFAPLVDFDEVLVEAPGGSTPVQVMAQAGGGSARAGTRHLFTATRARIELPFDPPTMVAELARGAQRRCLDDGRSRARAGHGGLGSGLSADELHVLFTVNDMTTGQDVWMGSRATIADAFVTHPAPEITTATADYPTWMSADGCSAIVENFTSGSADLFFTERTR